jgi:hypothetical protein
LAGLHVIKANREKRQFIDLCSGIRTQQVFQLTYFVKYIQAPRFSGFIAVQNVSVVLNRAPAAEPVIPRRSQSKVKLGLIGFAQMS